MKPTALTLVVGAIGALIGSAAGLPMPLLTGAALAVVVGSLAGLPLAPDKRLREITFLVLGIGVGAGVTPEALAAIRTWPMVFALLPLLLVAMMLGGQMLLTRAFGFDRRAALLACTPGHLSFVFALSESAGLASERIVLVQSVRLLLLSLGVPFAAALAGIQTSGALAPGAPMPWLHLGALLILALLLTPLAQRAGIPAPMMMAGLGVSALAHGSGVVRGGLHPFLANPALMIIGALLGTRFVGVALKELRDAALAGLCTTTLAALLTAGGALLAAGLTGFPAIHLATGYTPGGLQTMVVIAATLGANPALIAGLHVVRLLILSALIPLMLRR